MQKKNKKSHLNWSWVIIVSFFLLSIINVYFGLLGLICMIKPVYHSIRGQGKFHCSHHCPRGSFLAKFLNKISSGKTLPAWMRTAYFKHFLLLLMITLFTLSMIHAAGNPKMIGFALFRFMGVSFIIGIIMGIFYKPRTWCIVCPMGHAAGLITKAKGKDKKGRKQIRDAA